MKRPGGVRIIGLTGGIATGKSTVAAFLEKQGAVVVDADKLAREAVCPGSRALERIAIQFGSDMLRSDGTLNRKRLGCVVFADADKRRQLEEILHPEIKRLAEESIAATVADGHKIIFYMAPMLIESGAVDRVDEIWVVTVSPEVQLKRLMARDGIVPEEAERIIASQMPLSEKEQHGRIVIDNSGTEEQTQRLLAEIWLKETGNN